MTKLSIGQMAKLNNISIQALRLYDEMGILKPIEINQETGYRYYDVKQSAQLDMIQYMKTTGMSLKEIKEVFDDNDLDKLNNILHTQLIEIDKEIDRLNMQKKAVKRMINGYDRYLRSPQDGTITLEYIEERKIYSSPLKTNFYDQGLEEYESDLKDLKKAMQNKGIPEIYYYNAGTTIAKDDFINQKCISKDIFVFVDHDLYDPNLRVLKAGMYACMYCDDFDKEIESITKLYDYIKENKWQVDGDYICEVLAELPMTTTNKREMFLRLQVPIRFIVK